MTVEILMSRCLLPLLYLQQHTPIFTIMFSSQPFLKMASSFAYTYSIQCSTSPQNRSPFCAALADHNLRCPTYTCTSVSLRSLLIHCLVCWALWLTMCLLVAHYPTKFQVHKLSVALPFVCHSCHYPAPDMFSRCTDYRNCIPRWSSNFLNALVGHDVFQNKCHKYTEALPHISKE